MIPIEMKQQTIKEIFSKTFAEFFAGIGLMRMGLATGGWIPAFVNDIDPIKKKIYEAHFQDKGETFYLGDIHKINPEIVPDVTLATASFPCNDLSLAGARAGLAGKQSSAYWGFLKILDAMKNRRPPIVLLENVVGFLTSHGGKDFEEALLALNRLGYSVDAFIIDAVRFVPQSRVRLFVVGTIKNLHVIENIKETPVFYESETRPKALAQFIYSHPAINWNIRKLPLLPFRTTTLADVLDRMAPDSQDWWNQERTDYLIGQMSEKHYRQLMEMRKKRSYSYGTVFRRVRKGKTMAELRIDGIAGCLRTPRGGSGRQILIKAGYGKVQIRLLTPKECARLMGADDYRISVPLNQALFGFGDAVCVPVISWIAHYYINPLLTEIQIESNAFNKGQKIYAVAT